MENKIKNNKHFLRGDASGGMGATRPAFEKYDRDFLRFWEVLFPLSDSKISC